MIYLLDTNILIYLIKQQPPEVAQRVDALADDDALCMSFISWAELLKGAERSTRKPEVLARLDQLGRQVQVLFPGGPSHLPPLCDAGNPSEGRRYAHWRQ